MPNCSVGVICSAYITDVVAPFLGEKGEEFTLVLDICDKK